MLPADTIGTSSNLRMGWERLKMRMHDRVARALSDNGHRIDPAVFEQAAIALLSGGLDNVTPVPGGTDHGRDADIFRPGSVPIRVLVTSSRSIKGARANLVASLKSMRDHGLEIREVIAVSLAEMNQTVRRSLESLALEHGAELVAIYDRSYFIPALAAHGEWRQRLLALPGGPYSLSSVSDPARPSRERFNLVGRDDLVSEIAVSPSDLMLWGVAGAGKTAVLEWMNDAVFVQGSPSDERLLDDLIDADPSIVIVDDAGLRRELVQRLRHIRSAERMTFRIVAVCWPHELTTLAVFLPGAEQLEVPLLPRSDIAQIVSDRGIRHRVLLGRILGQASGRAGWAALLSDLLKDEKTRQSVFDGVALQQEVERFAIRAALPSTAVPLLAVIGLVGRITHTGLTELARHLGMRRLELSAQLESLATGGLIEVSDWHGYDNDPQRAYEVKPELLALSLAGTLFTAAAPVVSASELCRWVPAARTEILGRTIKCALMGVDPARDVAHALMRPLLTSDDHPRVEALTHYALLGAQEAREVFDLLRPQAHDVLRGRRDPGIISSPVSDFRFAIEEVLAHRLETSAICEFLALNVACAEADVEYRKSVKSAVDAVRGFDRNDHVEVRALTTFATETLRWFETHRSTSAQSVAVAVISEVLRASFDSTRMSLTSNRSVEMRSAWWGAAQTSKLLNQVWKPLTALQLQLTRQELVDLLGTVDGWAQIAHGFTRRGTATPDERTRAEAAAFVRAMVGDLRGQLADAPGLRARLRASIRSIDVITEEDPFLSVVFDAREPGEDWRRWADRRKNQILSSARRLPRSPEHLCAFLATLRDELQSTGQLRWVDAISLILTDRVDLTHEAETWVHAILKHRLVREASRILEQGLANQELTADLTEALMAEDAFRTLLIMHCLNSPPSGPYSAAALGAFLPTDAGIVEVEYFRGTTSDDFLLALLEHAHTETRVGVAIGLVAGAKDRPPSPALSQRIAQILDDLSIPPRVALTFEHELASNLRDFYPDIYKQKFAQAAVSFRRDYNWQALDFFEQTVAELPSDDRAQLWTAIPADDRSSRVFRALAGADVDWIRARLAERSVEASMVVSAMGDGDARVNLAELATLLLPYGVDPLDIAVTVQYGTRSGEDHERIRSHIEYFEELERSSQPEHQAVASAGLQYFRVEMTEALKKARRAEITGEYL